MCLSVQIPTAYCCLYLHKRLLAHRRSEGSKVLTRLAIACCSRSEGIAKEVKGSMLRVAFAIAVLAVDYLGLLFIQFQPAVCKPLYQA